MTLAFRIALMLVLALALYWGGQALMLNAMASMNTDGQHGLVFTQEEVK
jgi:hypothetical protein